MKHTFRFLLLAALGGLMLLGASAQAAAKKILVITQSRGVRHQPVNRKGQETCQVERILAKIGKESGVFTSPVIGSVHVASSKTGISKWFSR